MNSVQNDTLAQRGDGSHRNGSGAVSRHRIIEAAICVVPDMPGVSPNQRFVRSSQTVAVPSQAVGRTGDVSECRPAVQTRAVNQHDR